MTATTSFKNSWGWGVTVKSRKTGTRVVMAPMSYTFEHDKGGSAYITENGAVRLTDEQAKAKYFAACATHRQVGVADTQLAVDDLRLHPDKFCSFCAALVAEGQKYSDPAKAEAREPQRPTKKEREAAAAETVVVSLEDQQAEIAANEAAAKLEAKRAKDRERKAAQRAAKKALAVA